MANSQNLKPFQKGYDARRGSKPKGAKHLSTHIREALSNHAFKLSNGQKLKGTPIQAMINATIEKALQGDLKAFDLLAKHGYGNKFQIEMEDTVHKGMDIEQINAILERARKEKVEF